MCLHIYNPVLKGWSWNAIPESRNVKLRTLIVMPQFIHIKCYFLFFLFFTGPMSEKVWISMSDNFLFFREIFFVVLLCAIWTTRTWLIPAIFHRLGNVEIEVQIRSCTEQALWSSIFIVATAVQEKAATLNGGCCYVENWLPISINIDIRQRRTLCLTEVNVPRLSRMILGHLYI